MDNFPNWADHALVVLFSLVLPYYSAFRQKGSLTEQHFTSSQKKQIYISGSISLLIMGSVICGIWLLFQRPFEVLGFVWPTPAVNWGWIVLVFILLYCLDVWMNTGSERKLEKAISRWKKRTPFLPTQSRELPFYFLLCISAGIFEEIIYRGFLVTYFLYLFRDTGQAELLSVTIPAIVFALAHYYQGSSAVLKIIVLSVLFGFVYIRSGSLLIVMLLHFLVDAAGGFVSLYYGKKINEPNEITGILN